MTNIASSARSRHLTRPLRAAISGLVLLLPLAACAAEEPLPTPATTMSESTPTPSEAETEVPTLVEAEENSIGDLSIVEDDQGKKIIISDGSDGPSSETLNEKLILAEGGCYHATSFDGAPILLLFPTGSTLDGGDKPAVIASGSSYALGSPVTLTGDRVLLSAEQLSQAAACVPLGEVFRVASLAAA